MKLSKRYSENKRNAVQIRLTDADLDKLNNILSKENITAAEFFRLRLKEYTNARPYSEDEEHY
jgi:hypothetical protein